MEVVDPPEPDNGHANRAIVGNEAHIYQKRTVSESEPGCVYWGLRARPQPTVDSAGQNGIKGKESDDERAN